MAADANGYIWVYNRSNGTWTPSTFAGVQPWTTVAMSANGQVIMAGTSSGLVVVSNNNGGTWAQDPSAGVQNWTGQCCAWIGCFVIRVVWAVVASFRGRSVGISFIDLLVTLSFPLKYQRHFHL